MKYGSLSAHIVVCRRTAITGENHGAFIAIWHTVASYGKITSAEFMDVLFLVGQREWIRQIEMHILNESAASWRAAMVRWVRVYTMRTHSHVTHCCALQIYTNNIMYNIL